jgi:hypothetical protein
MSVNVYENGELKKIAGLTNSTDNNIVEFFNFTKRDPGYDFVIRDNILGNFVLPSGTWLLFGECYTNFSWFGIGPTQSENDRSILQMRWITQLDGEQYSYRTDIVKNNSDTTYYVHLFRDAAGTANIYGIKIKGIKIA